MRRQEGTTLGADGRRHGLPLSRQATPLVTTAGFELLTAKKGLDLACGNLWSRSGQESLICAVIRLSRWSTTRGRRQSGSCEIVLHDLTGGRPEKAQVPGPQSASGLELLAEGGASLAIVQSGCRD